MKTKDINEINNNDNIILCNKSMLENDSIKLNSIGDNSFVSGEHSDLLNLIEKRLGDNIYAFGLDMYILKHDNIDYDKLKEIHKNYDIDFDENKCYTYENKEKAYEFFYSTIRKRKAIVCDNNTFRNNLYCNIQDNNSIKFIYNYLYNRAENKEEVLDAIERHIYKTTNYKKVNDTLLANIKSNNKDINVSLKNYSLLLNNTSSEAFDIICGLYEKADDKENYKLISEFINYVNTKYRGNSLKLK